MILNVIHDLIVHRFKQTQEEIEMKDPHSCSYNPLNPDKETTNDSVGGITLDSIPHPRRRPLGEDDFESRLLEKGLNAPRLHPDEIDAVIVQEQYYQFPDTQMIVCCLKLRNGFCSVGESACASPENFDAEIGRQAAYKKARNKIWELEGYLLRQWLWNQKRLREKLREEKSMESDFTIPE